MNCDCPLCGEPLPENGAAQLLEHLYRNHPGVYGPERGNPLAHGRYLCWCSQFSFGLDREFKLIAHWARATGPRAHLMEYLLGLCGGFAPQEGGHPTHDIGGLG